MGAPGIHTNYVTLCSEVFFICIYRQQPYIKSSSYATALCGTASTSCTVESCGNMHVPADDLYLHIMLGCVYEQKVHGLQWVESIGMANSSVCNADLKAY
jgi:hypothetical protein